MYFRYSPIDFPHFSALFYSSHRPRILPKKPKKVMAIGAAALVFLAEAEPVENWCLMDGYSP